MGRLLRAEDNVRLIVVVSPWISLFEDDPFPLTLLAGHVNRYQIPTYVFTRPPGTVEQVRVTNLLERCPTVEIVYNPYLHAKIYACLGPEPYEFAILASANMTTSSASLYEVGIVVLGVGGGDRVVKDLADFGLSYLRTRPESIVAKKRGRPHEWVSKT
jgi:hypothetical protein